MFRQRFNAFQVHLIRAALVSLGSTLAWSAIVVYQVQVIGMTPLELVLAGTMMEISIFVFEIPTGIVADVYSRRLSSIIGFFLLGIGFLMQGFFPTLAAALLGAFVWGIGYTFTSGAYDAWLVDEIGVERAGVAFLRSGQIERLTGILGIVIVVALGLISLALPIVIGGLCVIGAAIFLLLCMPETGFHPTPAAERTTFQKMSDTFREGVRVIRKQPALGRTLLVGFFYGFFSEGWDRLWRNHLIVTFSLGANTGIEPIAWFGMLDIAGMAIGIGAAEVVRRRVNTASTRAVTWSLFWLTGIMVLGLFGYGLAPSLLAALGAYFVFTQARGLTDPLFNTWTNQMIPEESAVRATVLSMRSQTDAIGQITGGPPVGIVGNLSLRAVFVVCGLILAPALEVLRRAGQRETVEVVEVV